MNAEAAAIWPSLLSLDHGVAADPGALVQAAVAHDEKVGTTLTPLFLPTTFTLESVEKYLHEGYSYSRTNTPTTTTLESNLATTEGGAGTACFGTGEILLDGLSFQLLHHALRPPGVDAFSRYLGLPTAGQLRRASFKQTVDLSPETQSLLCDTAAVARAGSSDAARGLLDCSCCREACARPTHARRSSCREACVR